MCYNVAHETGPSAGIIEAATVAHFLECFAGSVDKYVYCRLVVNGVEQTDDAGGTCIFDR